MINIDTIKTRYSKDLMLKGKGGYVSGEEFNRAIRDAQFHAFEFLSEKRKEDRRKADALAPFVTEATINIVSGYCALPADYAHKEDWYIEVQDLNCVGNNEVYNKYEIDELKMGEYSNLLNSPIRRPSLTTNKYAAEIVGDNIKVYPSDAKDRIYLKYLKNPPAAVWGSTVDSGNDQENYDSGSSTNLEWRETEFNMLLDILLYLKGIQVRDSEIINWMSAKNSIIENA